MNESFIDLIKRELSDSSGNNTLGKISPDFVNKIAGAATKIYLHPTDSMRICILQLKSGHETYGVAQVLDPANDIESMGNKIAFDRAKDEIWQVVGSIAKALQ